MLFERRMFFYWGMVPVSTYLIVFDGRSRKHAPFANHKVCTYHFKHLFIIWLKLMLIPRQTQLAQAPALRCFHLWSRMAPGLALLDSDDLKTWAQKLLRRLAVNHAVDVQAFALEAGQIHLVLRWRPEDAAAWSDAEAADRWRAVHPRRLWKAGRWQAGAANGTETSGRAAPPDQNMPSTAQIRQKLGSLSMFMKHFKQMLTHKINKQFKHKGSIWKGRFHMAPLADVGAVAGAMAFVDLRQVVETGGDRPEAAPFTSLHVRVGRYQAMYGTSGTDMPEQGEATVFGPEVAQSLREGPEPWERDAPKAGMGGSGTGMEPMPNMGGMPGSPPTTDNPGMGMPPVVMPEMGDPMAGMDGTPIPGAMPGTTMMIEMPMIAAPSGGSWAGEPDPPLGTEQGAFWLSALRDDGPRAVLAWLTLGQYLKLLDALVEKAKAWPHLPAHAPGRAPAPPTPAWEGKLAAALHGLGLDAAAFAGQWRRLAGLRG